MPEPISGAIIGTGLLGAGSSIFGGLTQAGAADRATEAQLAMFGQSKKLAEPFINLGTDIIPLLKSLITPGGGGDMTQIPGLKNVMDWTTKSTMNAGSRTGFGGNVTADLSKFLSSQAFFPFLQQLMGLVNTGQSAAAGVGSNAIQTGGQIGSNMIGAGNAIAGSAMGAANSLAGIPNSMINLKLMEMLSGKSLASMYATP